MVENANEGTDTVFTNLSYVLGANVENLTMGGVGMDGGFSGMGNDLANIIVGNSNNNLLRSYAGNDMLDGGLGADTMLGGAGNDTYIVDNSGDIAAGELFGGGVDEVRSSVDFMLGLNIEKLFLTGGGNIAGTGNALANTITGNTGNNFIDGRGGADTMVGGKGNDTYILNNLNDKVTELAGEGSDTIIVNGPGSFNLATNGANVENLIFDERSSGVATHSPT